MDALIKWLMSGDISLKYLTCKYLLHKPEDELDLLRKRIAADGWGKAFLAARNPSGHWGRDFYQVKWISSHYTLLDLRALEIEPAEPIRDTLERILRTCKSVDGSINESHTIPSGDLCVNGMFLNYASFFGIPEKALRSIVDFILDSIMPDGGFNCNLKRYGAVHSSMHTTISVLEGLWEFVKAGHDYRKTDIELARGQAEAFLLAHKLFRSDKTGEIIDKRWCMLSFPSRWRYDILRALVYFADAGRPYDPRMEDALSIIRDKRLKDGTWPVQLKHPGKVHFEMEKTGEPSRFNTLRALRVLGAYGESGLMEAQN
ncbi:prenyltransferase/squalene oxidase repeat-containing protein [Acidaminobacter hydrogenoformans]|uniref:Prenyltransferase and squalene oxidase repeat-containing protein n=1 Tax=Acidaminobacter hydrogenoformans DSM 2784 TaxID=1120920 RepID=A0A1G5S2V7_9FIRM|nr:hypothetical protein [Acidaminobacter hydrogenoformans]SCZ79899.1 hypothetical protein SAMN03080599_02002 [Acidaminobacter hydrogenoformans DSM 2784]